MEKRVLFFKVGGLLYGLDLERAQGIENLDHFTPVACASQNVKGLMSLRGEILPIYSLAGKFGVPQAPFGERTQVIVGKLAGGLKVGFLMDEVQEIVEVDTQRISEPPKLIMGDSTEYVESVISVKGRLAVILALDRILSREERESIEKLLDEARKREQEKKEEEAKREIARLEAERQKAAEAAEDGEGEETQSRETSA